MTAPSPGILTRFIINLHYPSEDAYLAALAEVLKVEYRAIVDAGFVLQIDAPDLGAARNNQYRHLTDNEFRAKIAERNIAALNAAIAGLPADRMRLHICWGNYEGPHTHDLPLLKIIDIAFKARVQGLSIEAANPRHDHEWEDLKTIKISRRQNSHSGRDRTRRRILSSIRGSWRSASAVTPTSSAANVSSPASIAASAPRCAPSRRWPTASSGPSCGRSARAR